jgi:hypothetical protein
MLFRGPPDIRHTQKDKGPDPGMAIGSVKQRVSSLAKLFYHVGAFQTITKRAVILSGANAAKH